MIRTILLFVLLNAAVCAFAADDPEVRIMGTFASKHWTGSDPDKYNERNIGIGLRIDRADGYRFGLQHFKNSYYDWATTVYAGRDFFEYEAVSLGAEVHLVQGYEDHIGSPIVIMPTADFHITEHLDFNVRGIPFAVLGFGLSWRIE